RLHASARYNDTPPARPYHVVAFGSGDCEHRYRAAVARVGLAHRVSFRDFVPDVAPVLRQLDLLVMPSLWEAAGILAMEALCLGVPVLGSDCIGLREVLRGTPARLAPPGDADAWAAALRSAIAAPWSAAARAYVSTARVRFDVRGPARELELLFDRLCGRDASGRVRPAPGEDLALAG